MKNSTRGRSLIRIRKKILKGKGFQKRAGKLLDCRRSVQIRSELLASKSILLAASKIWPSGGSIALKATQAACSSAGVRLRAE